MVQNTVRTTTSNTSSIPGVETSASSIAPVSVILNANTAPHFPTIPSHNHLLAAEDLLDPKNNIESVQGRSTSISCGLSQPIPDIVVQTRDIDYGSQETSSRPEVDFPFSPFDLTAFMDDMDFQLSRPFTSQNTPADLGIIGGIYENRSIDQTLHDDGALHTSIVEHTFPIDELHAPYSTASTDFVVEEVTSDPLLQRSTSRSSTEPQGNSWRGSREVTEDIRTNLLDEITRLNYQVHNANFTGKGIC